MLVALAGATASGQTVVTWTGAAGDGNYSNPANWNSQVVPVNAGASTYTVIIPANATVNLDMFAASQIAVQNLVLGSGARINTRIGRTLTVVQDADIRGNIDATGGGGFISNGGSSVVAGNASSIPWFRAANNGVIRVNAVSYSMTPIRYGNFTIMSADTGATLDLSRLTTLDAGWNDSDGTWYTTSVTASNGGVVDLSGVQSLVTPARSEDRIEFGMSTGGVVNLNGLQQITGGGQARIIVPNAATYALPSLATANNLRLDIEQGATVNMPLLTSASGAGFAPDDMGTVTDTVGFQNRSWVLGSGATLNAPALAGMNYQRVVLGANATFNAPQLTRVNFGLINLGATGTFNSGTLTNVDNTAIWVSDGRQFGASTGHIGATTYTLAGYRYGNGTALSASGAGSLLDLSTIRSFNAGWNDDSGTGYTTSVTASNGGVVDLSGVQSLVTPARGEDRIEFSASAGGRIDLRGMRAIAGGGAARFNASGGGQIQFGDLTVGNNVQIALQDLESVISFTGSLSITSGSLSVAAGAELSVGKHLTHRLTNEASFAMSAGILSMTNPGLHFLEVAGLDVGPVNPGNNGNFGIGRIVVGTPTQSATLQLLDLIDNANRGGNLGEALYIFGVGQGTSQDALVLQGGSTLYLDNINVYARENGNWIWLNSLFGPGQTVVAYGGGYLHLPEPGVAAMLAVAGIAASRRRRVS